MSDCVRMSNGWMGGCVDGSKNGWRDEVNDVRMDSKIGVLLTKDFKMDELVTLWVRK